jgi:predicted dehydrogenase
MIRLGIIGLDSTHAVEFVRLFNIERVAADMRVVAACAGAPTTFPLSLGRRERIERQVRDEFAVPVVNSAPELLEQVDAVLLLSCDGRSHGREIQPVLAARKPVFVDKPLSADWREAAQILRSARVAGAPCFTASALRFRIVAELAIRLRSKRPLTLRVDVPRHREPGHPDLSWHGIHGVEAGYAVLGAGCQSVRRSITHDTDVTTGVWPDGSSLLINRTLEDSGREFRMSVASSDGEQLLHGHDYRGLVEAIAAFFRTGRPPVSAAEMIEVLAFIAAADESRVAGGAAVGLTDRLATVEL